MMQTVIRSVLLKDSKEIFFVWKLVLKKPGSASTVEEHLLRKFWFKRGPRFETGRRFFFSGTIK